MKIADIKKGGGTVKLPLLITGIEGKSAKNGSVYCRLTMTDGTEQIVGHFWDIRPEQIEARYKGHVADVTLEMGDYVTVKKLRYMEDADMSQFVKSAPVEAQAMYDAILERVSSMKTPLRQVVEVIYKENHDQLCLWAGAQKAHHNVCGGLLYHMYRMMQAAEAIAIPYSSVNLELLIIGCVLHDIGKLRELTTEPCGSVDYTAEGNLIGHMVLGTIMVHDAVCQINASAANSPEKQGDATEENLTEDVNTPWETITAEEEQLLAHMILSHHGTKEYGAVILPCTLEATLLHQLDMIDSRTYIYEDTLSTLEPGQKADPNYFLEGTRIYRPNL